MRKYMHILAIGMLLVSVSCGTENKIDDIVKLSVKHTKSYKDSFDSKNPVWESAEGSWVFAKHELVQTEKEEYFPLIILRKNTFTDVDVSVKFKPLSGHIDASGGIVFRAKDKENYYIVRANALEDNFRLYYFKNGSRYEIASATVIPPELQKYSTIRVVAKGDHIQAYLNGVLRLDHHDGLYSQGYVGLWTKADSVTAFDDFTVSGEK